MNKQLKQLIILVVVFVALLAVFFGLRSYNEQQAQLPEEPEEVKEVIIDVAKDDIVKITYDYEGETLSFEKKDDTWYYAPDPSLKIVQYHVKSMLAGLAPFEVEHKFENIEDLAQYGLAEPERVISFEANGTTYTFYVGIHNEASQIYYICLPDDNTVYTIDSYKIILFNESLDDLVEKPEESAE